jgi:hypothetical protein
MPTGGPEAGGAALTATVGAAAGAGSEGAPEGGGGTEDDALDDALDEELFLLDDDDGAEPSRPGMEFSFASSTASVTSIILIFPDTTVILFSQVSANVLRKTTVFVMKLLRRSSVCCIGRALLCYRKSNQLGIEQYKKTK